MHRKGLDAIGYCLKSGVRFTEPSTPKVRLTPKTATWYQCPRCFQPIEGGFPDVICLYCWYEGSSKEPFIELGQRPRFYGRKSREVIGYKSGS